MEFSYDPQKSDSNKAKHGIDFHAAQALWRGRVIEIDAEFRNGEKRYTNIGKIDDDYWTAIITYRDGTRRIISVYPSNSRQIERYERTRKPTTT